MNKFLFELGLEEIPPDMIAPAVNQMRESCRRLLEENQIQYSELRTFSTPRRLALIGSGLPDRQPDREEQVLGPPEAVAYDEEGQPTRAAKGFAKKSGIAVEELEILETDRGSYVTYRQKIAGQETPTILGEILPQIVESLSWPKNMYWRESRFRFIRPLRWYVALWNETVLPFQFEGVRAGNKTRGHRFLGNAEIEVNSPDEYLEKLQSNFVLADVQERRERIVRSLQGQVPERLFMLEDPGLLETLVHLTEYPSVIRGSFSEEFLKLPQEVLVTVMRHHQKYFSVVDEDQQIQPYFLTVLNVKDDPERKIRQGHEKVLQARLEDAFFFWETDRKRTLADRVKELEHISFQEKLGTYREKTERLECLCADLSEDPHLDAAASLCKADLTCEMVREFTELQGVIGGLYAREEGYPQEVWKAVYEQYKPATLEDDSPETRQGALLSLADKLDTIVGCFGIDIVPTGSSDPFALRRQAQGAVKILFDYRLEYELLELVEMAQKNFAPKRPEQEVRDQILDFLLRRVRYIFQEKGIAYDVINAVLAVRSTSVYDAFQRAEALSSIRGEDDFDVLAIAYKRIKNILDNQSIDSPAVSEQDLVEAEEQDLYATYQRIRPEIERHLREKDYAVALKEMAGLRACVDRFFDTVLVMTEDEKLRTNRLRLLQDISDEFLKIADISEIVHESR